MASRLMRGIAHASSASNITLVDAMSLTWLLLMLLFMVVLELLSSRGSLACPAAGGSRGGRRRHFLPLLESMRASTDALETRNFLPSLYESISPDQTRPYALLRLAPCTPESLTPSSVRRGPGCPQARRISSCSPWPLQSFRAMRLRGPACVFVCATIEPSDCGWRARRERRWVEVG